MRQQLLDAIYSGQSFRTVLRDLGLTSNQVWGLTKTYGKWSEQLEAALMATRRNDLQADWLAGYPARGAALTSEALAALVGRLEPLPAGTKQARDTVLVKDDHQTA